MPVGSITFDLTGSLPDASTYVFTEGGLTLTVSSGLYLNTDFQIYETTPILNQTGQGIGMLNPYDDLGTGIDGDGKKEVAVFSFSESVHVTSVTLVALPTRFNETATGTQFRLFGDDLASVADNQALLAGGNALDLYADVMGLGADRRFDMFRIAAITVEMPQSGAAADDSFEFLESATTATLDVLDNDSGIVRVTAIDAGGVPGTITIAADGQSLLFDLDGAYGALNPGESAVHSFTYTGLDTTGATRTATVTLTVNGAEHLITGTDADETLPGTAQDDRILGLEGADKLTGLSGRDTLIGDAGNDTVNGGDGSDSLKGNDGYDRLVGGDGSDTLNGCLGRDQLAGGDGADEFRFGAAGSANYDRITDFATGTDRIGLNGSQFGLAEGALAEGSFVAGTEALDADDRVIYDQTTGELYLDADGAGGAAKQLVVDLLNGATLVLSDIFVF
jgi:VCBS repeat-containing protein